jgi:hypothetical protein
MVSVTLGAREACESIGRGSSTPPGAVVTQLGRRHEDRPPHWPTALAIHVPQ